MIRNVAGVARGVGVPVPLRWPGQSERRPVHQHRRRPEASELANPVSHTAGSKVPHPLQEGRSLVSVPAAADTPDTVPAAPRRRSAIPADLAPYLSRALGVRLDDRSFRAYVALLLAGLGARFRVQDAATATRLSEHQARQVLGALRRAGLLHRGRSYYRNEAGKQRDVTVYTLAGCDPR